MTIAGEHLCHKCVSDPFLADIVKAGGDRKVCMACGVRRYGMPLLSLAFRIDEAISEHYVVSRNDDGTDYSTLVTEVAGVSSDIAEQIQAVLSNSRGFSMAKDGEQNIYEATFDEAPLERFPQHSRWQAFKTSIRQEARFFNRQAEQWLDEIFEDINTHADWRGQPVVRTVAPGEKESVFYRGRVAFDEAELQAFLKRPELELGPPPAGKASAGRMNAAGVSVFYGAEELKTCRAEIRPPVGSHTVFAQFSLVREVRLLDFDMLRMIKIEGSLFDPDYIQHVDRIAFLRTFGAEISQPIMPRDEVFGYLPTQIVADYIAQRLGFDGLFFRSTQAGGSKRNIVLFNHAARVAPVDRSDVDINIDMGWWDEDEQDGDDSITIEEHELEPPPSAPVQDGQSPPVHDDTDPRPLTLRIVPDSLEVQFIKATDYDPNIRSVSRYRFKVGDLDNLPF